MKLAHRTLALGCLLFLPALCASAEPKFRDLERPGARKPHEGLVIEWVSQEPKVEAVREGDRAEPPDGEAVAYTAHVRNLGSGNTEPVMVRWLVDGLAEKTGTIAGIGAGQRATVDFAWAAESGRHWIQCELVGQGEWLTFATDALTVKVGVEKKTLEKYEAEFGSFARRFQDSLAGLHASWASVREVRFAPQGIEERLRVDDFEVYERGEGDAAVPAEFRDHPRFSLYVACDQGGPVAGFFIPGYSIGHNYAGHPGHESLFSDWGENCLWHEIAHFRGVEDFYAFPTKPGDVAKAGPTGQTFPLLELRPEYADDTMNNPYKETCWSDYTAAVLQMKRGVARVGRCEDPHNTFGHMWRHVPAGIVLQVIGKDGKSIRFVDVEVYRPVRSADDGRGRVAEDAAPLFAGKVGEDGTFTLGDDPFGKRKAEADRALWLLVVLRREGVERARYLTLLDMNMAYWRGQQDKAVFQVVWE